MTTSTPLVLFCSLSLSNSLNRVIKAGHNSMHRYAFYYGGHTIILEFDISYRRCVTTFLPSVAYYHRQKPYQVFLSGNSQTFFLKFHHYAEQCLVFLPLSFLFLVLTPEVSNSNKFPVFSSSLANIVHSSSKFSDPDSCYSNHAM